MPGSLNSGFPLELRQRDTAGEMGVSRSDPPDPSPPAPTAKRTASLTSLHTGTVDMHLHTCVQTHTLRT